MLDAQINSFNGDSVVKLRITMKPLSHEPSAVYCSAIRRLTPSIFQSIVAYQARHLQTVVPENTATSSLLCASVRHVLAPAGHRRLVGKPGQ
jgi:hypothetical protein